MKHVKILLAAVLFLCSVLGYAQKKSVTQNITKMKILFVLTSNDQLGNTGKKTGFWVEEFATPYYLLVDKGVDVTIASPKGGQPPIDPKSAEPDAQTEATKRFDSDKEVQQLKSESQRIAMTTTFGTQKLIDGSGNTFDFQVGIYNDDFNDRISFDSSSVNVQAGELGIDGFDFTSKSGAQSALETLDVAQSTVNGHRATLGALQNRLQSTIDNTNTMHENLSAANSRIRDTDVALASSEMTRNNILLQASTSTLAQANQVPALALKLIG